MLSNIVGPELKMRRIVCVTLLSFAILTCPALEVAAQPNHNLEWGVEIGDEIDYLMLRKTMDPSFQEMIGNFAPFLTEVDEGQRIIARVDHLDSIPEHINDSMRMPSANCTLLRHNDSVVIMEDMPMLVTPTGDWEFISENTNLTWSEDVTVIDTEVEWGYSISSTFVMGIIPVSFSWEMRYFKSNGTMSIMSILVEMAGNALIDVAFALWDPDLGVGRQGVDFLLVGLSVSAAVIVIVGAAFLVRRRRGPKALVAASTQYE
jgi:hypothetical protein